MGETSIAIIGCGAIGTSLATELGQWKIPNARLVGLYDVIPERRQLLAKTLHQPDLASASIEELIRKVSGGVRRVVVEAASQAAVKEYGELVLEWADLLIMSTGALLNEGLYERLKRAAAENQARIYLPTGAIGAIDAVRAAAIGGLHEVTLITRKPPLSLSGAPFFTTHPIDLDKISQPQLVYEGSAKDAIAMFPANVNVAAILSLAGLGAEKTRVRIVADPSIKANIHRVEAIGESGKISVELENQPHPLNPKTSFLAVLSALELLRQICNPMIKVGT